MANLDKCCWIPISNLAISLYHDAKPFKLGSASLCSNGAQSLEVTNIWLQATEKNCQSPGRALCSVVQLLSKEGKNM